MQKEHSFARGPLLPTRRKKTVKQKTTCMSTTINSKLRNRKPHAHNHQPHAIAITALFLLPPSPIPSSCPLHTHPPTPIKHHFTTIIDNTDASTPISTHTHTNLSLDTSPSCTFELHLLPPPPTNIYQFVHI